MATRYVLKRVALDMYYREGPNPHWVAIDHATEYEFATTATFVGYDLGLATEEMEIVPVVERRLRAVTPSDSV